MSNVPPTRARMVANAISIQVYAFVLKDMQGRLVQILVQRDAITDAVS